MDLAHPSPSSPPTRFDAAARLTSALSARPNLRPVPSPLLAIAASAVTDHHRTPSHGTPYVKVLGSVCVEGAQRRFSSARALDVITYLAFHRDGADAEQLRTWLWPVDAPPSGQAFANVLSRARQGLGNDVDGRPWLTHAGSDRVYRLRPGVRTDADDFRANLTRAGTAPSTATAMAHLRSALDLVRGQPFTGGASSLFLWADHRARNQLIFLVDETVHRTVDLAMSLEDFNQARAALDVGLRMVPGCELCVERRFQVAAAEGNITDLRAAMTDLLSVLAADYADLTAAEAEALVSRHLRDEWRSLMDEVARR